MVINICFVSLILTQKGLNIHQHTQEIPNRFLQSDFRLNVHKIWKQCVNIYLMNIYILIRCLDQKLYYPKFLGQFKQLEIFSEYLQKLTNIRSLACI